MSYVQEEKVSRERHLHLRRYYDFCINHIALTDNVLHFLYRRENEDESEEIKIILHFF